MCACFSFILQNEYIAGLERVNGEDCNGADIGDNNDEDDDNEIDNEQVFSFMWISFS